MDGIVSLVCQLESGFLSYEWKNVMDARGGRLLGDGSFGPQGDTLLFSPYVGSGPASTVHPKNIRNFKHPKKIFEILSTQKISPFCTLPLIKDPKMHRNGPKYRPILW